MSTLLTERPYPAYESELASEPKTHISPVRKKATRRRHLSELPETITVPQSKVFQWRLKRFIDLLASGLGLLALSPLLLLVMALVKLDSPGPCFIRQRRIGYLGQEFYMYKFRTMVPNADKLLAELLKSNETNDIMFKMKDDPRITRLGKWLRRYSVDELPQLWNVFKGEMSLVGPRPPLRNEVNRYRRADLRRFGTLPGLTGYWQVSGRADIKSFQQVVSLDVQYIREWSVLTDIRVLLKTIPAVIFAKGAA